MGNRFQDPPRNIETLEKLGELTPRHFDLLFVVRIRPAKDTLIQSFTDDDFTTAITRVDLAACPSAIHKDKITTIRWILTKGFLGNLVQTIIAKAHVCWIFTDPYLSLFCAENHADLLRKSTSRSTLGNLMTFAP